MSSPPFSIRQLRERAKRGEKTAMLTCYDATTARWLVRGGCEWLLVGDTAAQMVFGHANTLPVTMEQMVALTAGVRRGAPEALLMADMPFGSYHESPAQAVRHAVRFMQEGGADMVKLELADGQQDTVRQLALAGVPVVAHLGCRPQAVLREGGYPRVGGSPAQAQQLLELATSMLDAGACLLLLEAVTEAATAAVVEMAHARTPLVPVVGCGAGPACDGQVVVLHDLLGLTDWQPPFAQPLVHLGESLTHATRGWLEKVGQKPEAEA